MVEGDNVTSAGVVFTIDSRLVLCRPLDLYHAVGAVLPHNIDLSVADTLFDQVTAFLKLNHPGLCKSHSNG